MNQISLTQPDDWHLHLRDGAMLERVVLDTARCFRRAIVMPNLKPPVTTVDQAGAYRRRIMAALPEGSDFEPLMTLYLTEETSPGEIRKAADSGFVKAVKYYPAGATTNSDSGVRDLTRVFAVFEAMQEAGLPLLLHGEVTDPETDAFDREHVFIERYLQPLCVRFPQLPMVLEHITTREAAEFVRHAPEHIAATITVHHLLLNRNAMFEGGINPHHYCLPLIKRETHRRALVEAATSGEASFFLGTDSAPHVQSAKETGCGCAGIYSAPVAIELYAEVFEQAGALDQLEAFASFNGADFYGLPRNTRQITLQKKPWRVAASLPAASEQVVPLRAGQEIGWSLINSNDNLQED